MKPTFIISCPIDTYSGYGARSRDLVKAIIELDKYNVKILQQRWGNCPWNFIKDHYEDWKFLEPYLVPLGSSLTEQPDIWAQVSVPNEFQAIGKYNIGFTAGIETTMCAGQWLEGLNRMNINFVSSQHSKEVFQNTVYQKQHPQTKQIVGEIKLEKPVEVLIEGADLTTYLPKTSQFNLDEVKESFAYLFVGHWMQGNLGEDRKNVGLLIKSFYETFKNKKKTPALILKCSGVGSSYMDRETILNKINQVRSTVIARTLPNVYLLHGEFTDKEINEIYNHKKVKAMVSLTKGEGFGRPLLEFSLTKKPIISTNWSGHVDFLSPEFTSLINGELKEVHSSAAVKDILLTESKWFNPSLGEINHYLTDVFENYKLYKEKAVRQAYKSKTEFSFEVMKNQLSTYLTNALPKFPEKVELNLPPLKMPQIKKLENVKG